MGHLSNWSSDSQAHTRICVLESQNEVKGVRLATLESENFILKKENESKTKIDSRKED